MTTITRNTTGPLRALPLLVPGFLLALAVLLAPSAPSKVTGGLYRIDTPDFAISHYDIDCAKSGTVATCTTPVAGKTLTIVLDTAPGVPLTCTATYGSEAQSCSRAFDYGPGSHRVQLGSLGVAPGDAEALREAVPWWSTLMDGMWIVVALGVVVAMAIAAGVLGWLWTRQPREADRRRKVRTAVTVVAAWSFPVVAGLLLMPWDRAGSAFAMLIIPHSVLLPVVAMAWWQWSVSGPVNRSNRVQLVAGGVMATALYGAAMSLLISVVAGFPD